RRVRSRLHQDHVVVERGVDRRLDLGELGTAAGGADGQDSGGGERRDSDTGQSSEKEAMERHDPPMPAAAPGETGFSGFLLRRAWMPHLDEAWDGREAGALETEGCRALSA